MKMISLFLTILNHVHTRTHSHTHIHTHTHSHSHSLPSQALRHCLLIIATHNWLCADAYFNAKNTLEMGEGEGEEGEMEGEGEGGEVVALGCVYRLLATLGKILFFFIYLIVCLFVFD
mgnify:CR=1 FL=1